MPVGTTHPPNLSPPTILTPTDLTQNEPLANHLLTLINPAFKRPKYADLAKWDVVTRHRFDSASELIDMLGDQGVMAVIFDREVSEGEEGVEGQGKVVACAGVIPWGGEGGNSGREEKEKEKDKEQGWELKIVCVDDDVRYAKTGLAGRVGKALEEWVIVKESERRRKRGDVTGGKGVVKMWILVAECLNGAYWRRRGFKEVRRQTQGKGVWGVKTSFEMLIMARDVEFVLE